MNISRIFSLFMLFKLFSKSGKNTCSIKLIMPFNFTSIKNDFFTHDKRLFCTFQKKTIVFIDSKILKFNFLKSGSMIKSNIYYKCFFGDECIW